MSFDCPQGDEDYDDDIDYFLPKDDDYAKFQYPIPDRPPLGDTDVSESEKSPELKELELLKKQVEIRKLTAEAERHELEARRARQESKVWDASADEHRIYHFIGGVDASNTMAAQDVIGNWARRGGEGREFTVVFNSPGGSVIHGLALYDFLEDIKTRYDVKLKTVARGMAASMGGILLQAGDSRVIGPNAHLLIHEVSSFGVGKISEIEDELKFMKKLQDRCVGILASKSSMSKRQIETKWKKKDWWLDAEETVKLGFADVIG
jgi:ATP-dependent Clp endopeptidase proteolytic subunit ClpP